MVSKWHVNEDKAWFKKWWPEVVPKNLEFDVISFGDYFDKKVEKFSNLNLIHFLESWMTFRETKEAIDSFATALTDLGLKKGDCVALLLPNSFQYVISFIACAKLGVIATGINPTYKPLEILHHIEITKAKAIIVLDALYEDLVKPIITKTNIEFVISTNIADMATGIAGPLKVIGKLIGKIPKGKVTFNPTYEFMTLLKTAPNVPKVKIDPIEDTMTYIMTGGTTGIPKATNLTHFNIVSNAIQSCLWLGGERPGIGDIGVIPLFHSFAMTSVMTVSIACGGWMFLYPRPPETKDFLKDIDKIDAPEGLIYVGAEILFKRLAEYPELHKYDIMGKLSMCLSGAGPLHAPVRDMFEKNTGGLLVEGYGLSEASPIVSGGSVHGKKSPIGCIGMPFPGTDWGIFPSIDFDKGPIADGLPGSKYGEENTGEICVCGPQVMKGYLNQPEETSNTLRQWDNRTWLLTGDIGFMRDDGTVVIMDRKKQLIKVAGHSVFPKEVESMLMMHEAVSEAAVAGLPDPEGKVGEISKAWVELKPEFEGKITTEELKAWTEENLTKWKCPAIIDFIPEVPKSILGKVQRRVLQENDPLYKK